jgi:hypothetical protein
MILGHILPCHIEAQLIGGLTSLPIFLTLAWAWIKSRGGSKGA